MINRRWLNKVAREWGIQPSYINVDKQVTWSDPLGVMAVLSALSGIELRNEKDLEFISKQRRNLLVQRGCEPTAVVWEGKPTHLQLYLHPGERDKRALWTIEDERGSQVFRREFKLSQEELDSFDRLSLPTSLPLGYLTSRIQLGSREISCILISAPYQLGRSSEVGSWGLFAPMYALREAGKDEGIGSLCELRQVSLWASQFGAQFVGTLPILAAQYNNPRASISPYSAMTRLFWNEIFLDLEDLLVRYPHPQALKLVKSKKYTGKIDALRSLDYVDYQGAYTQKRQVLELLAQSFFESGADKSEPEYQVWKNENPDISDYVKFQLASQRMDGKKSVTKGEGGEGKKEAQFHFFSQYQMSRQLRAFNQGPCGLYLDYPVGVTQDGFDFDKYTSSFLQGVSIGAPPEKIFALGQNWCMPALHPHRSREDGYLYFRRTIQNHMRHCKLLRLDHIMGLHRIYVIPEGKSGREGVYLRYKPEELFALVTLEAQRAGVDVIGENLGTVPEAVQSQLDLHNWNGMKVFQFEIGEKPSQLRWTSNNVVSLNTHDTATFSGFLKCRDLEKVCELKILPPHVRDEFRHQRMQGLSHWFHFFGLPFDTQDMRQEFFIRTIDYLSQSQAKYLVVSLEDLWKEEEFQNIPGTSHEVPNWRRKFKLDITTFRKDPMVIGVLEVLKKSRRSSGRAG